MFSVSRIVPKTLRRGPFGVFTIHFIATYQKIEKGTLWRLWKVFKKSSESRKKGERKYCRKKIYLPDAGKKGQKFVFILLCQLCFVTDSLQNFNSFKNLMLRKEH